MKLGLRDITGWIECELNGYQKKEALPPHRFFSGGQLQFLNPYHGWRPAGQLNQKFPVYQPVSELEALANSKSIVISLTHDQHFPLRGDLGLDISDWQQQIQISTVQLKGMLSAVRDKLLDWSLELEQRGIMGKDMSFNENERNSAQGQTFHIQNFTGVLGDVSHSHVQVYDYSSLHQTLKQQNVSQQARNELENIMDDLKSADPEKKKGLIEKAKAWIVKNEAFLGASASIVRKALGLGD